MKTVYDLYTTQGLPDAGLGIWLGEYQTMAEAERHLALIESGYITKTITQIVKRKLPVVK